MRRAFSDTLVNVAKKDSRIIFLTGDLGFQVFDEFIEKFGARYVNTGVAEAQLVNAAVGLALEGWRPIIYSIAPFVTARPYEQIRFGIAYHNLPVMIVGAGGGFTYARAGVTHHSPDDLALMSALPNMTVVAPGGPDELEVLMPKMLLLEGPSYLRVGKFGEPNVGSNSPIALGKARPLIKGEKVAILTLGDIVSDIKPEIERLHANGIKPGLFHYHTIKPLDTNSFSEIEAEYEQAIVLEECIPQGGLFQQLCCWKATTNATLQLKRYGAPDSFVLGNPTREELRQRIGVDAPSLGCICKSIFEKE
ncbi:MAG: transketolase C-terminal domain-containing protein [Victivallaceae bacterium]|jgi:transketolase